MENMTSSTKPKIRNLFYCSQRRTESRSRTATWENFVKFASVILETCERTDRQTLPSQYVVPYPRRSYNKNSSGDEIANVNFFYDDIVHVEASAYAHLTDFIISSISLLSMLGLIYAHKYSYVHLCPSNRVIILFCPNNRWIIVQIVLVWS